MNEESFRHLWFMYILTLIGDKIKSYKDDYKKVRLFISKLEDEGLLNGSGLRHILINVRDYVSSIFRRFESVEGGVSVDPTTATPKLSGKITMSEPTPELRQTGTISVYDLIEMAEEALYEIGTKVWITFDRLDVAFSENPQLETLAIKTLFRVYNDIKDYDKISLKIFIRDDIWKRISMGGFREASHITKQVTIRWTEQDLLHLLVSRAVDNDDLIKYMGISKSIVLTNTDSQREFFYNIFPEKVDTGRNPETFKWMISRVKDGLGIIAPRELIHLLNESRDEQIKALETGTTEDSFPNLISRKALKEALIIVSRVRLEQTIYPEYPHLKPFIESLEEQKTEQDINTLSKILELNLEETRKIVSELVNIGIFEDRKGTYWTPFLYRGGLRLSQGRED